MQSILDDKLLSLRLKGHVEFHVRLAEFLSSYGVLERPALVAQARPLAGSALTGIDVNDAKVQARFGAGVTTSNGWWQGFRSMTAAVPTFHGIAGLPNREKPKWASELHRDGHFIAGIWSFPGFEFKGSPVEAVSDFYVEFFLHFLELIASTLKGLSEQPIYETTWTLTHTPELHYASASMYGKRGLTASPLQFPHLQWQILNAPVGTSEWKQLAVRMGQALTGAYGNTPPSE